MKKQLLILITIALMWLGGLNAQPLSGTYTIGPSGNFTSITGAVSALNSNGFSGGPVVFELMADYLSSVETFPVTFPATLPTTVANTLTLRPAADATALSITHTAGITLQLNGAYYVTIDGRPGGTGVSPELTISNTLVAGSATAGIALQLINGASSNTIQYCNFTGVSSSTASAVVSIYTSTAATGNNNNLIDHCNIYGGATKPTVLFVSSGSASKANTANIVSNNNFYNWQMAGVNGVAMTIGTNNTNMVVTGNSFYQTIPTTSISQNSNAFVNIAGANGTSFTSNYLGGSAPLCAGTPMSLTYQTYYGVVRGINLSAGTVSPTSIQGNTIANIEINAPAGQSASFIGINQIIGVVNIGNVTPNIIGSPTVPNSINIISNGSASFTGISVSSTSSSADQTNISGNIISGVSMNTGTGTAGFTGINASSFYTQNIYVTGNTIGSTTMANAISNSTPGTTVGISNTCRYNSFINNNTIANLTSLNTAASGNQLIGISASGSLSNININDNNIFNLSSSSAITGTAGSSSLIGISVSVTSGTGHSVTGNAIYGLLNNNTAAAVKIAGITYSGPTTANNVVAGNFIHSLNLASSETASSIAGIYALNGNTSYHNNMIRLGIDAAGNGITTGYAIHGIRDEAITAAGNTNSFYHNTVYIGGTGITGTTSNTFAFNSTVVTNVTIIRNNILVNARSGGSAGKHYAIATGGTVPSPAGLTSSHNIFFVPGTGGTLGLFNATDRLTLADWQNATALDVLSAQTDPMLMLPEGSSTTLNLHVQASNPIEGSGVPIAAVTDDFDGDVRSSNTPTDIGADAGNFTNNGDLFPPNIAFTPLLNTGLTTSPSLSAEITDGVGVSTGANQPRIYFKKATDANAFAGNTSADNGWKYTQATVTGSTYTFLLDYSILNGGSAAPGDVIQYFIVAQDDAHNFASAAPGATASSATNPVQNINGAPSTGILNSYLIINNNISGTFTVPGNYPTLTGAGGLFEAVNTGTVTGNFTVQITDNLAEPGTFALNQFAAPYTMTIVPASASLKTITGNVNDGLIRFNGADNVTIDGRFGGSGNWLEFINTSTGTAATNCAVLFTNGATYNTVKYSNIKASSGTGSVIYFYAIGTNTGNNSFNTIDHCNIDGSAAKPTGITSYYNTTGGQHVSNTISNCNIYDFTTNGISLAIGLSDWTISGNSFYQTAPRIQSSNIDVIIISIGANHIISGNYIGGSAPMCGGSPWTITGTGNYFRGINLYNTTSNFLVENNTISNFNINTTTSANAFYGVYLSLTTNGSVTGNTIGSTTAADAIVINRGVSSTDYGIYKSGTTGVVPVTGNSIGGFTLSSTTTALSHGFMAIYYTGSATTVNNNIIGSVTVPNSIYSSTASVSTTGQSITGISTSFPAGVCAVSGNTIANITNNYQGTAAAGTVRGISTSGVGSVTINGNTISNLSNAAPLTGTGNTAAVIAIADNATGATKVISNNMVTGLSSASAAATVTGIYAGAGTGSYYNNVVNLGGGVTTGSAFTGIQIGAGTSPVYYNTVNITGVAEGTSLATYAFYSLPTGVRNYRNNNFVNTRSGGTSGTHYAIRVAGTAPAQANLVLDYNNYFVSGPALGFFNNLDVADLAAWKLAVGYDVNSISADPLFTSATDLHTNETALNSGTPVAGITLDYAGTLRSTVSPTMGAYETNCNNPTTGGVIAAAVTTGCDPFDPAMITSTSLPAGNTGTLEYKWQQSAVSAVTGFSDIANSNSETFDPGPLAVNTWFKRLARVDCKGTWDGAAESNVIGFTVISQPVSVTITESENNICAGTQVTFTALPVNGGDMPAYQWYKNGSPVSTASTYTYAPANNDQVYLQLTSNLQPCGNGVTATSNTITMVVNPIINVSATIFPSANNVCDGTSVSYFAMVTNGGAAPVYQWKVNGQPAGTNMNNYTYIPANGDAVTCEVTPNVTCPSANPAISNSVTMTVYSTLAPEVTIAATATTVCEGTEITFTATPVNGTASPTYQWYKNGTATGTNSPTLTGLFAHGDAVYVTLTVSPNPCIPGNIVTSNTIMLTVNPMPVLVITNPAQVTLPATTDLTNPAVTAGSTTGLDLTYWQDAAATLPYATPTAAPVGIYYIKGLNTATGCYDIKPVMVTGLISYWHLDEASGNIYADAAGFNNGTGNVSPTAVTGQVSGAQQFNGTNTKIEVPANPSFDFAANGNFSVEFWYKGTATSNTQVCVGRYISYNNRWYVGVNANDGKVRFYIYGGNTATSVYGSNITDGNWHYVTATRNGTTGISKVYVDGILKGTNTVTYTSDFSSPSAMLNIGSFNGGFMLSSGLDEVAVHNLELQPTEISQHYTKGTYGVGFYDQMQPIITSSAPLTGSVNQTYTYDVESIGFPVPTYSLTVSPAGMTIDNISGLIQWVPSAAGDFNVTVEASNGINPVSTQSFVISVPVPPVVIPGLVAYYRLNELSGNTFIDYTGINDGIGNLSPTAVTGQVTGAQQFNGTNTKIEVQANPTFDFAANGNFSVEFWYKGTATSNTQVCVGRYISYNNRWYVGVNANDGKVRFYIYGGNTATSVYGSNIADGNWHYVTATRNGTAGISKVYVDGILKGTNTVTSTSDFSSPSAMLNIGNFNGGSLLNGSLDEVAVHNLELQPTEISQHYTKGTYGVGYYDQMQPIITSSAPLTGLVNETYTYDVESIGFPAPTYSLTVSPDGMTIDNTSGLIQWVPTAAGDFNVTVEASNGINPVSTQSFVISVPVPPVVIPGLVAYYRLDELSGNTFIDYTGINNGIGNLSPIAVTGQVNGAQQFNGTNTKIEVPANPTFDFASTGNFSVEFWYKGTATANTQVCVGRYISYTNRWYVGVNANDGKVRFYIYGGNTATSVYGSNIADGNWHYVTATRNGTTGISKVYVDGILKGTNTVTYTSDFSSPSAILNIGSFMGGFMLNGDLDEVAVHNLELTLPDIQQHYNNSLGGLGYFDSMAPIAIPLATETPEIKQAVSELRVYSVNNDEITVVGHVNGGAEATLYDMYGKPVQFTKLDGSDLNIISTPGVGMGIYILRINDHGRVYTFKLLLKE